MRSLHVEKGYRVFILITALLLAIISAVQAWPYKRYDPATDSMRRMTFVNIRQGCQLFQNFCLECHRDLSGGAGVIAPESRIMSVWNEIFQTEKVPCAKEGYWNALARDQLSKINDYLYHEAPEDRASQLPRAWNGWGRYRW